MSCFAVFAAASPGPRLIARFDNGAAAGTIQVQLANLRKIRTRVAIQDLSGQVWFSEYVIREDGYAKNLNLSGMPKGQYVIFVKNTKEQYARVFNYTGGDVLFFEESKPKSDRAALVSGSSQTANN